jgi:Rad51 protein
MVAMETRRSVDPLQPKTWQLDSIGNGNEGYLYHCILCDEALVLSKEQIIPRKIELVFDGFCPSCGFELDKVLGCRASPLPAGRRLLTSLKCRDPELLREPDDLFEYKTRRGNTLPRDVQPNITTGIESLDKALILKKGQFVFLEGEQSHSLSLLLCVRAALPAPQGLDSDVVFIDAGNLFDTYTISHHTANLGLETRLVEQRIHLSRAFTHHQVHSLIMEKLTTAIDEYGARFAVVSDITALFCDPDVRDKREALDIFRRSVQFLATTAERRNMLILATNQKARNKTMTDALMHTAHVSAKLKDKGAYTQLTIARHPFTPQKEDEVVTLDKTLLGFLQPGSLSFQ